MDRLRHQQSLALLKAAGWGDAARAPLAGDASARRYERLTQDGATAVLMDAPPRTGDDPAEFVAVARHLRGLGLSAPDILAEDLARGFLLLEDLGDALYARELDQGADEIALYTAAVDVLAHLHRAPAPHGLPDLRAADWAMAIAPAFDSYRRHALGEAGDADAVCAALTRALTAHADGPRVMILRDYHAENLLWLPDRAGVAQVGLLDFQLAQMGQRGYDLVSLLQDARRDVPPATEEAVLRHFDPTLAFRAEYAVLGLQRNLRILGIFARLAVEGGKPRYLALIPRVWGHVQRNLTHPALAEVAALLDLPAPTPDILDRIARCRP
ncbi:aminoglycoside phosphotransferase family protein [Falsirhodobacter halotolerans]|uniref:aminoglycoside phosphotransferase family protein n=1 Tax=Falsirhodobacter halotolerans TaxID=1146892 RepID=UPI001FD62867|nr:phosphotransferase [Falsirhodobacter halotolerans]MCJ8140829.1 phosphotransferase [Falsirhodobacter halotolerans]